MVVEEFGVRAPQLVYAFELMSLLINSRYDMRNWWWDRRVKAAADLGDRTEEVFDAVKAYAVSLQDDPPHFVLNRHERPIKIQLWRFYNNY
jgi:hypothetical protein